jgi:hypothetical protein
MSGPQPYIMVNCTMMLYNGNNTKFTLQAYGGATGAVYNSKIVLNGGGTIGAGDISFINDDITICTMNSSGLTVSDNLTIGNGLVYLSKAGNATGTLKLGVGVTGADDNTNMKIEIIGVSNGASEAGNMILGTYVHMKFYSIYDSVPQMFINGQQSRIGIGTATPDARLHVTTGISNVFGDAGTSTW